MENVETTEREPSDDHHSNPLPFLTVPRSQQGPLFPSLFNLSLIGNADPFWPGSADSTDAFNNFDCDSRDLTK